MKGTSTARLAASIAGIAESCPTERLGPESRYVIVSDLRMGDGGKKDELALSRMALFTILGRWYLPRGYTLVLNGDVEDLRSFWLKDILSAWPEVYALFDAFAEKGRLRKIAGERDLALLRIASYPYKLAHALRLEAEHGTLLVLHGHQASPPYVGRDYMSDFIQRWLHSSKRPKAEGEDESGKERYKTERRLYRAASRLGIVAIEGHTRRPLFESLTNRDSVRAEVERLLREGDPLGGGSTIDALIDVYRRESRRGSARSSGQSYDARSIASPCLFCPGRLAGAQGLRFLEIEGDCLRMTRWTRIAPKKAQKGSIGEQSSREAGRQTLEGTPYLRVELHSTAIGGLIERVRLLSDGESANTNGVDI